MITMGFIKYILQDHRVRYPRTDIIHILGHYLLTPSYRLIIHYRAAQYFYKKKKNSLRYKFYNLLLIHVANKYCATIDAPIEIGEGLKFDHGGPFVLNPSAIIGKHCTIHPNVLIGGNRPKGAPVIGDNYYIGNGAKIIGPCRIGDWVFIAPGAIITKDVPSEALMGSGLNNLLNMNGKKHVELYY